MSKNSEIERNRRYDRARAAVRANTTAVRPPSRVRCGDNPPGSVFACPECRRFRREERGE